MIYIRYFKKKSIANSIAVSFLYRCACCGHTAKENRQSQSKFECLECGYIANADINGARNILAAGHAVLACGGMVQSYHPLKQEPTEMIQALA